jgi:alkanesulfonate monooxygenase SsuD/methylene tetrahydromethanopterin reductase-like flavin-dependent oxidoreductase (luciferase family)
MQGLQIGWKAGPEQYPPQELLEYAVAAEVASFASIDASDHFHPWSEDGQASFIWAWLGAAAARTSKIELGTGLTCPILRYHPAVIAQAAATMGALAPGRFFLSVGAGEALNEYAATAQWPGFSERQERLGEAIGLIRALWKGEPVTWDGKAGPALRLGAGSGERCVRRGVWRWAADRWRRGASDLSADARQLRAGRAQGRQRPHEAASQHRANCWLRERFAG